MPLFSIIVPTYNVEKYITDCLNSIVKQNFKDYEVIIIDDGSTDNTLNIVSKFVNKNNKIRIKKNRHKGISEIRNIGICSSIGDYIIFVDSDTHSVEEVGYMIKETTEKVEKFNFKKSCLIKK